MDPAVFERLIRRRDWTVGQYECWFTSSVGRLLIGDTVAPEDVATARRHTP
jgi:hypothetical protein